MTLQDLRSMSDDELMREINARLQRIGMERLTPREPYQEALDGLEPLGERLARMVRIGGIGASAVACAFILWWLGIL